MLWLSFFIVAIYIDVTSALVTDFDASYLYLFKKTGAEQIPLASFYRLKQGNRGSWRLYYYDERGLGKKLVIQPVGRGDNSSIHDFIAAIWPHNPQLDVKHDWLFR